MSKASEVMERLLQGEQVEWVKLGEISDFFGGLTGKNKTHFGKGNGRYIPYTNIFNNKSVDFDSLEAVVVIDDERQNAVHRGDVLLTLSSETLDEVGMSSVVLNESQQPVYMNSFCLGTRFKDKNLLIPEFSKYLFRSNLIRNQIRRSANGVTRFNLSRDKLRKIEIPIPPLHVQEKIVSILDTFTELTKELTKEQQARQTQYEYYRDKLLTFEDGEVEWDYLGSIGEVRMCRRILKNQTSISGDIPFYKIGTFGRKPDAYISRELFQEYKNKYSYPEKGEILISASGTIGRTVIFDGEDAYFQDSNIVWVENDEKRVINKFLYYVYQVINWNAAEGGTIRRLYTRVLTRLQIPIPPLHVQQEIVDKLDRFNALANSITEGLPREIELRQQQYEYYRDLLLDFPNAA